MLHASLEMSTQENINLTVSALIQGLRIEVTMDLFIILPSVGLMSNIFNMTALLDILKIYAVIIISYLKVFLLP